MTYANILTFDDTAYDAASAIRLRKDVDAAPLKREPRIKHQLGGASMLEERDRPRGATTRALGLNHSARGTAPSTTPAQVGDAVTASLEARHGELGPTTRLVALAVVQQLLEQVIPPCARWAIGRDLEDAERPLAKRTCVCQREGRVAPQRKALQAASTVEHSDEDIQISRALRRRRAAHCCGPPRRTPASATRGQAS